MENKIDLFYVVTKAKDVSTAVAGPFVTQSEATNVAHVMRERRGDPGLLFGVVKGTIDTVQVVEAK